MLWQIEQYVTRSFTSRMASARRSVVSRGVLRTWNASRWAPLGPIPGSRCSSSMRRTREGGRDIAARCRLSISESGQLQSAHHTAHLLRHLVLGLALGVVDGGHDQVL